MVYKQNRYLKICISISQLFVSRINKWERHSNQLEKRIKWWNVPFWCILFSLIKFPMQWNYLKSKFPKLFVSHIQTFLEILYQSGHTNYSWNIEWQKCARMGLNGFHIKWIIGTHCNWKNQNPGSPLGATS